MHAASDTEYEWPWYGKLVGIFSKHPSGFCRRRRSCGRSNNPSTSSLPLDWGVDGWYNFKGNPRSRCACAVTLDEKNLQGRREMNSDHPDHLVSRFRGRPLVAPYRDGSYQRRVIPIPLFLMQLLGGIEYAAGRSRVAPADALCCLMVKGCFAVAWG